MYLTQAERLGRAWQGKSHHQESGLPVRHPLLQTRRPTDPEFGRGQPILFLYSTQSALWRTRCAHRRYRGIASASSRYVVADGFQTVADEFAVYIRNIGYPSHKRTNQGLPVTRAE
jgi:hypothetical protein